jgi:hypothetical protein
LRDNVGEWRDLNAMLFILLEIMKLLRDNVGDWRDLNSGLFNLLEIL